MTLQRHVFVWLNCSILLSLEGKSELSHFTFKWRLLPSSIVLNSQVLLVSLDPRVSMVGQVPQVSQDPQVDQESLDDLEHQDYQVTKVKRVVMESQAHLESKESLVSIRSPEFPLKQTRVWFVFNCLLMCFCSRTSWIWWPWSIWTSRITR